MAACPDLSTRPPEDRQMMQVNDEPVDGRAKGTSVGSDAQLSSCNLCCIRASRYAPPIYQSKVFYAKVLSYPFTELHAPKERVAWATSLQSQVDSEGRTGQGHFSTLQCTFFGLFWSPKSLSCPQQNPDTDSYRITTSEHQSILPSLSPLAFLCPRPCQRAVLAMQLPHPINRHNSQLSNLHSVVQLRTQGQYSVLCSSHS